MGFDLNPNRIAIMQKFSFHIQISFAPLKTYMWLKEGEYSRVLAGITKYDIGIVNRSPMYLGDKWYLNPKKGTTKTT